MNMDINLEYYKVFYHAARLKSYSRAADYLHLTQPAITHSVKRLEELLQIQLFYRNGHSMLPTEAGELLYTHVAQALELISNAQEKLEHLSSLKEGTVRIGATETALNYYTLPLLKEFKKLYPGVSFQVLTNYPQDLRSMLLEDRVDLVIGTTPFLDGDTGFSIRPLQEFQDVFVAGNGFPELRNRLLNPSDLIRYPLVSPINAPNLKSWMESHALSFQPQFVVSSISYLYPFIKDNLAVGCVPEPFAREWLSSNPQLFILSLSDLPPQRSIVLVTNPFAPLKEAPQVFVSRLLSLAESGRLI